ncbi:methyltransferase [Mycetocola reblochoni REB411]|uniref:Methyltransferase n=1 Tax=Mycetocola reblochoni REB411 TaxID=1255698 RepID=A0A1R4IM55_9MICO|nr:methyltransferase [Mycetocola reblochoni REB411]
MHGAHEDRGAAPAPAASEDTVRAREAYGARAAEYTERFGGIEAAAATDRRRVLEWARAVHGPVLDVGCGPGQWTAFLAEHGVEAAGIDPTPEFVAAARRLHPGMRYRLGHAESLAVADGALGGVLAWYSLIHIRPERIDDVLREFARALRPGGGLAIGFVEAPVGAAIDHAVTTAYAWPVPELSARVERAGFTVVSTERRTDPGARPHGSLTAMRGDRGDRGGRGGRGDRGQR